MVEGNPPPRRQVSTWPRPPCVVSGVHASQAQELRDFFKKHGEHVEVTNEGDPIYTSRRQRQRCLKMRGMVDKNYF
jgi:hypothetical protein